MTQQVRGEVRSLFRLARSALLLAGLLLTAHAAAQQAVPAASGVAAADALPTLNQPRLVLPGGQWLVAGGAPAWAGPVTHAVGQDSELFDPNTRQWQRLEGLSFPDATTYSNLLSDGSVLFFAVKNGEQPAYLARRWNLQTGVIETLAVDLQAMPDDGIAVLADGRVLIVDSLGGGIVVWDSASGQFGRGEMTLLENSGWRALPLPDLKVLLFEVWGAKEKNGFRYAPPFSTVLVWDATANSWQQLPDLPVQFQRDGLIYPQTDGILHAEVPGSAWQLASGAAAWTQAPAMLPPAAGSPPAVFQRLLPKPVPVKAQAPVQKAPVVETETRPWWHPGRVVDRIGKWLAGIAASIDGHLPLSLALFMPLVIYWLLYKWMMEDHVPAEMFEPINRVARFLMLVGGVLIGSSVLYHRTLLGAMYPHLQENIYSCVDEGWTSLDIPKLNKWVQCVEAKSGKDSPFKPTADVVRSLPASPCQYVGSWMSIRPGTRYIIQLDSSGHYYASPSMAPPGSKPLNGVWGVADNKMVWFTSLDIDRPNFKHPPGVWPTDINEIKPGPDEDHFTLEELNGMETRFERIKNDDAPQCY